MLVGDSLAGMGMRGSGNMAAVHRGVQRSVRKAGKAAEADCDSGSFLGPAAGPDCRSSTWQHQNSLLELAGFESELAFLGWWFCLACAYASKLWAHQESKSRTAQ